MIPENNQGRFCENSDFLVETTGGLTFDPIFPEGVGRHKCRLKNKKATGCNGVTAEGSEKENEIIMIKLKSYAETKT